jgi:hypothetical protein
MMTRLHRAALALVSVSLLTLVVGCGPGVSSSPTPSVSPSPSPADPNYVIRGNLARSLEAFESGGTARVAFMGGSVTTMDWREQVQDYLEERFPDTEFDFINAGLNGTPAVLGAFRLEEDVFSRGPVDLLFLEFAVNYDGRELEPMEGIVRHARALSPDIDIVQIHVAADYFSGTLDGGGIPGNIVEHERVAEHYGNCSLHLYQEIYDRIAAGEFTSTEFFATMGVHPGAMGNAVYADFVIGFLETMWNLPDQAPAPASTPAPLSEHPWEHATLVSYEEASSISGFEYITDWMPEPNGNLKEPVSLIASSTPGSTVSFSFSGTMVGYYSIGGPDSAIVEYQIDDLGWVQLDTTQDTWPGNDWYRISGITLSTSLTDGPHAITFRTTANDGTVFRLYRLMVG